MIDARLIPYFDLNVYFIEVSNINECLLEFQKTQRNIVSLIKLKAEFEFELSEAEIQFKTFISSKRDEAFRQFKKYAISPTEKNLEDAVIKLFPIEYRKYKELVDNKKIHYDATNSLIMAIFQRKDMLCETINFFRSKIENDNCLAKNKEFLKKLGVNLNGNS